MVAAIDTAIMLKSTEELMNARAAFAQDAATYAVMHALDIIVCEICFRCALILQVVMRKQLEYLSKTQFVSCLSGRQLSLFFEKIKDSVKDHYKTYEAGEHLFRENDDSGSGLFLIKEGEVKVRDASNHTTSRDF
jgi:hypothetical protein